MLKVHLLFAIKGDFTTRIVAENVRWFRFLAVDQMKFLACLDAVGSALLDELRLHAPKAREAG